VTQPIAGEIRMFAGNYAPRGWAFCDGQVVNPDAFPSLYAAIGTTYGGDGKKTFALPDMRGRVPIHRGKGNPLGASGGSELADVDAAQVPSHPHTGGPGSSGSLSASGTRVSVVVDPRPVHTFATDGYANASGGNNAHENMQPFLSVHFIIALDGDADPVSIDDPFIGEIRLFAGRNIPSGWKRCDGQVLDIAGNPDLFSTVGTAYGGDGVGTFAVPDLRERVALHAGQGDSLTLRRLGEEGGAAEVVLTEGHLPYHTHQLSTSGVSGTHLIAAADSTPAWPAASGQSSTALDGAPHNNMQPYLVMTYMIATRGTVAE
jgi:microcystin-dependent protein